MADLFSKEYLKDLLASEGLADAAMKTVEAAGEELIGRALEGKDEQTQDRIRAGTALAREAKDAAGRAKPFSADYLKELMSSDNLLDLVSGYPTSFAEETSVSTDSQRPSEQRSTTSSSDTAATRSPEQHNDRPAASADAEAEAEADTASPASSRFTSNTPTQTVSNAAPRRSGEKDATRFGSGGFLPKVPGVNANPGCIKSLGAKSIVFLAIVCILVFNIISGSVSSCSTASSPTPSGKPSSSTPIASSSTILTEVPYIVSYGFGGGTSDENTFFSVEDQGALSIAQEQGLSSLYAPKGLPCMLIEDGGKFAMMTPLNMDIGTTESLAIEVEIYQGGERFVHLLKMPLDTLSVWYPHRQPLPDNDWGFMELLAYDQTVDGYMVSNRGSECVGNQCAHAIVTLQNFGDTWSIQAYCTAEGGVTIANTETVEYDSSYGTYIFPEQYRTALE